MSRHIKTGVNGEAMAAAWFQNRGFTVLHRNWRHGHCEIDIVATKGPCLHFIEVKTRTSLRFGFPEQAVTPAKLKKIMKAAEQYLEENTGYKRVQYDVLSITLLPGHEPEYFYIEDVYV
jgi:putative endonuclease